MPALSQLLINWHLLLDRSWQFFDLVFAMHLRFGRTLVHKLLLFVLVDKGARHGVKVAGLPEHFGGLCPHDIVVELHFVIVVLQIAVCDHIVVSLGWLFDGFASDPILHGGLGAFTRWLEMVLLQVDVADDVVVVEGVLARPEVPGLVLRVVGPALQALQLVLEVQNVVSLLDAQSFVLHTRNEKSFET